MVSRKKSRKTSRKRRSSKPKKVGYYVKNGKVLVAYEGHNRKGKLVHKDSAGKTIRKTVKIHRLKRDANKHAKAKKGRKASRKASRKRKSRKRKSAKRKSAKRKSRKRKSAKRKSRKRKSAKRKSRKRKSAKRKSRKRKSTKRKASRKASRKRKSTKRKASRKRKSTKRKASRKRKSTKRKASRKRKSAKRKSRKRKSAKRKSRKRKSKFRVTHSKGAPSCTSFSAGKKKRKYRQKKKKKRRTKKAWSSKAPMTRSSRMKLYKRDPSCFLLPPMHGEMPKYPICDKKGKKLCEGVLSAKMRADLVKNTFGEYGNKRSRTSAKSVSKKASKIARDHGCGKMASLYRRHH